MDERLIETIAEKVLEILHKKMSNTFKLLAVFTGGTIGLAQGFQQLKMLLEKGNEIAVVLSDAAETMIGAPKIKQELGEDIQIILNRDVYCKQRLREIDALLVPVLTLNSAAKLACNIQDTLPCMVIMQALMMGKPVLAARNACSPLDEERIAHGMGGSTPALIRAFNDNLEKLKDFGVSFVDVSQLAEQVGSAFATSQHLSGYVTKKRVISAGEIKQSAFNGVHEIKASAKDIITPLAYDVCREYGVIIKKG